MNLNGLQHLFEPQRALNIRSVFTLFDIQNAMWQFRWDCRYLAYPFKYSFNTTRGKKDSKQSLLVLYHVQTNVQFVVLADHIRSLDLGAWYRLALQSNVSYHPTRKIQMCPHSFSFGHLDFSYFLF